jgi:hypothetical protein
MKSDLKKSVMSGIQKQELQGRSAPPAVETGGGIPLFSAI